MSSSRFSRKRLGAPAAILIACAIIASGTWAWYDFTQSYSNTFIATSESDYDPILIDEFAGSTRDYDGWVLDEDVPKLVYVTYDHNDPLYEQYGGHPELGEDPANWKPAYVRVNLSETIVVHNLDDGNTHQAGPTIYKGTENSSVEWTLGATVKTVAQWKAEVAVSPSAMNGPFWILDTDGWFYWAEPLRHGESTEPLLTSVKLVYLDDSEELDYFIDVQMEAIDFGLRDFDNWRDRNLSTNPTMGIGIRPLFGLTDFGVDPMTGENLIMPITPRAAGSNISLTTVFIDGINIYAAGYNATGLISDGTTVNRPAPVMMMWDAGTPMNQRNVKDIKQGGLHTLIQKSDGTWWSVGRNNEGQLSNGSFTNLVYPQPMMWDATTPMDDTNVLDLQVGGYYSNYILRDDGKWYGVGNNGQGQLSDGTQVNHEYPVAMEWSAGVPILDADIAEFVGGEYNVFLLKRADNNWYGVGHNSYGQLAQGASGHKTHPVVMKWDASNNITGADKILGSAQVSVYLQKANGSYWAVGRNNNNQLSDGTLTNRTYPVAMKWDAITAMDATNVEDFGFGWLSVYVLKTDGVWYAQGNNSYAELSRGDVDAAALDRYPQPMMWDASNQVTAVSVVGVRVNIESVQFEKPDGTWWAAGRNNQGQLVGGTTINPQGYPIAMLWDDGTQMGLPR